MNVTIGPDEHRSHISSWRNVVSWDDDPIELACKNSDYITTTNEIWDTYYITTTNEIWDTFLDFHDLRWDFNRNKEIQFIFVDMEH